MTLLVKSQQLSAISYRPSVLAEYAPTGVVLPPLRGNPGVHIGLQEVAACRVAAVIGSAGHADVLADGDTLGQRFAFALVVTFDIVDDVVGSQRTHQLGSDHAVEVEVCGYSRAFCIVSRRCTITSSKVQLSAASRRQASFPLHGRLPHPSGESC